MPSHDRSAVRAVPALAALLLSACATPSPPPPSGLSARVDPFVVAPAVGYPMTGTAELTQEVETAYRGLLAGRDLSEVEDVAREVLAEDPGFHPAAVLLAQVEYLRPDDAAATELLQPVVEELPEYTAAQLMLGRVAERSGDLPAALGAFASIAAQNELAGSRAERVRERATEIVLNRLRDEIARGRPEYAEEHRLWLEKWAAESHAALEGTRLVAKERGDLETELGAVARLAATTGEREYRQREAELEVEIGDLRSGLEKLEALNREFPDDPQLVESLEQAEFLWRLQLLPQDVQDIGRKTEIDRADVSTLLYWLVPRVRYSQISNPPIATDILDHPRRDVILRVLNLGLMEVDETLHRFEPAATASRIAVLRAQLALLSSAPRKLSCIPDATSFELDQSWSSLCRSASHCRLVRGPADCRPAAAISGAEALEFVRQTLNLLGSGG